MTTQELSDQLWALKDQLDNQKREQVPYSALRATAEQYIALHYQWQKAKYGSVKKKLSPMAILR